MEVAISVNDVPIRLTPERWVHIVEARDELAGRMDDIMETVERPDWITSGYHGALVAWKSFGRKRYLAVVYKEVSRHDGFVVTAFTAARPRKRNRVWPSRH